MGGVLVDKALWRSVRLGVGLGGRLDKFELDVFVGEGLIKRVLDAVLKGHRGGHAAHAGALKADAEDLILVRLNQLEELDVAAVHLNKGTDLLIDTLLQL